MSTKLLKFTALAASMVFLAACTAPKPGEEINDPYESANRVSHAFNKGADAVIFRPASQVYGAIAPQPLRNSISNVADNLDTPRSVVNGILQGDAEAAIKNTFRFLINTTVGVFGLFDPAQDFGIEPNQVGFGDTLAKWGVREGAYVELPLFGPSTERDAVGQFVDVLTNPLGIVTDEGADIAAATSVPSVLNSRYEFADTFDSILYESADSYVQMRLFYLESRRFELAGQNPADEAFDPYENLYEEVYEGLYDEFSR
ncbi:MAG: VacJ family lipoprotein [Silicimonas sp.]|nr:VacJ family lipoprotein [Silicimonas sp.]